MGIDAEVVHVGLTDEILDSLDIRLAVARIPLRRSLPTSSAALGASPAPSMPGACPGDLRIPAGPRPLARRGCARGAACRHGRPRHHDRASGHQSDRRASSVSPSRGPHLDAHRLSKPRGGTVLGPDAKLLGRAVRRRRIRLRGTTPPEVRHDGAVQVHHRDLRARLRSRAQSRAGGPAAAAPRVCAQTSEVPGAAQPAPSARARSRGLMAPTGPALSPALLCWHKRIPRKDFASNPMPYGAPEYRVPHAVRSERRKRRDARSGHLSGCRLRRSCGHAHHGCPVEPPARSRLSSARL